MRKQLKNYEEDTKYKLQRQQEERRRREKEMIDNKIKLKKDEIRK